MQLCINDIRRLCHTWCLMACVMVSLLTLAACSSGDDDIIAYDSQADGGIVSAYLQVKVQVATGANTRAATRADGPNGGEEGDGREDGVNKENVVNNITLLLYTADGGINTADSTSVTIAHAMYFPSLTKSTSDDYTYITSTKEVADIDMSQSYNVIVIANAGDMTSALTGKTLSYVRDYLVTKAWTEGTTIADYSNFVMTSEEDGTLAFSGDSQTGTGTETNPFTMTTTIERIAARIDFDVTGVSTYTTSENTLSGYIYNVYADASSTTPKGYFVLTHVMPFNELNSGSYLVKRVCTDDDVTTGLSYLGDETATNDASTNYIVDPWWGSKSTATYKRCYTSADAAKEADATVYGSWGVQQATSTSTTESYYILDYTMENTTSNNSTTYATGLYFRGTYYEASEWNSGSPTGEGSARTYVYYLRHSDPGDSYTTSQPMLYGVVRNNIYRVSIEKVLEADTAAPQGLVLTINVRKWMQYTHSAIVM